MNKLALSVITTSALLLGGNLAPALADSCDNAPDVGSVFKYDGPEGWKLMTTLQRNVASKNGRKIDFYFKRLKADAKKELLDFWSFQMTNDQLSDEDAREIVKTDNEDNEDSAFEAFESFRETIASSRNVAQVLRGSMELGRCITLGEEIRITMGIKSDTFNLASGYEKYKESGPVTDTSENKEQSIKPSRRDRQRGYSGYDNLNEF